MKRSIIRCLAAAGTLLAAGGAAADPIMILEWSGYDDPAFHQAYSEKYGEEPAYSFYADDVEGYLKVKAGFQADLAHPCMTTIDQWSGAGLIEPIDTGRIPEWASLMPQLTGLPGVVRDGKVWMVPFDWGNAALVYRTDLVPPEDANLGIFTNPKYQGKVAISSLADDAYGLAILTQKLGDFGALNDPAKFRQASDYLRQVNRNQRMYWSDSTQLNQALSSGEVVAAWAWNEAVARLKADGVPVAMATEAGVSTFICGLVHVANGEGDDQQVYDYINAMLEPRSGQYLIEAWGYGHSNAKSFAAADEAVLAEYGMDDFQSFLASSVYQADLKPELQQKLVAEFEQIMAGF